jgi:hypothetical protein
MKKMTQQALLATLIAGGLFVSCQKTDSSLEQNANKEQTGEEAIKNEYIVVLKDDLPAVEQMRRQADAAEIGSKADYENALKPMEAYAHNFMKQHQMDEKKVLQVYGNALNGFVANLTPDEVASLKKDGAVLSIEKNHYLINNSFKVDTKSIDQTSAGGQNFIFDENGIAFWARNPEILSGGIRKAKGFGNGVGKVIYVIDTGVDPTHPDLNVDVARSANFITQNPFNPQTFTNPGLGDFCGHGTAVAGFAAAKNNGGGVVGVAAGATVVGVKVLYKDPNQGDIFNGGTGANSDIIRGIDYVAAIASPGEVCNISIFGGKDPALDNAVIRLANKGVYVTICSGNSYVNTAGVSPAGVNHPRVFTVSAIDFSNNFAPFSNFGADVDYTQVGISCISTLPVGRIIFGISGTSFSAPVVAGILTLNKTPGINGFALNDPDGNPDRIAALF